MMFWWVPPVLLFAVALLAIAMWRRRRVTRPSEPRYPSCLNMDIEVLPEANRKFAIRDGNGMGKTHYANPYKWTCTCKNAPSRRKGLGKPQRRAPCVHLTEALLESGAVKDTPWEPMLRERRKADCFFSPDTDILIGFTPGRDWIDIYAQDEHPGHGFRRFGYNLQQRRWTSGRRPQDSQQILKEVNANF